MGKDKKTKPEPRTFAFACNVVGVPRVLANQYAQVLGEDRTKAIIALLDAPDRFMRIRDALFSQLDELTKAAASPETDQDQGQQE